jgi:hypothetical protein
MARVTDTSIVRDYCLANGGGVFDLNYLSTNLFRDIPHVNLRKIVTRLCDSGVLRQVSKGVYFIGDSEATDDFRLEDHYTFDGHVRVGMLIGQSLLYKLGFCKYEPEEKVIRTSKTVGNKKIGNLQILETKSDIAEGALHTYELEVVLELLEHRNLIDNESLVTVGQLIEEYLKNYYKDFVFKHLAMDHPRNIYIQLAQLLDSMRISHTVMDIYVEKTSIPN